MGEARRWRERVAHARVLVEQAQVEATLAPDGPRNLRNALQHRCLAALDVTGRSCISTRFDGHWSFVGWECSEDVAKRSLRACGMILQEGWNSGRGVRLSKPSVTVTFPYDCERWMFVAGTFDMRGRDKFARGEVESCTWPVFPLFPVVGEL